MVLWSVFAYRIGTRSHMGNKASVPRLSTRGHTSTEHSIEIISFHPSFMYKCPQKSTTAARRCALMWPLAQVDLLEG